MIRFGPSGIPLSCKGRTLRDGIEDVHNLGLTALEVQLVRVNVQERPATDDEIGLTPREIQGELVVEAHQPDAEASRMGLDSPIEEGDTLYSLTAGVASDYLELMDLGALARELDIELSLHAPYYMDLADVDGLAERSMDAVRWGGLLAEAMGCDVVSTHIGLYGDLAPEVALDRVTKNLRKLRDDFKGLNLRAQVGVESSGRQEVIGSMDELLHIAKNVKGVVPVLNFAHLHARSAGALRAPEDFAEVMRTIGALSPDGHLHTHFSGVEHEGGNELRYTPIKKGDLRFEPLAEALLDDPTELTLVSSSPLLEHDAMYMKVIFERILAKRLAKKAKEALEPPPPEPPPERVLPTPPARRKVPRPKARPRSRARPKARASRKPVKKAKKAKKPKKKPARKAKKPAKKKAKPKPKRPAPRKKPKGRAGKARPVRKARRR
jgi:deoxyribonuclease-4